MIDDDQYVECDPEPLRYPSVLSQVGHSDLYDDKGFAGFNPLRIEVEKLAQWWAEARIDTDLHCHFGNVSPQKYELGRVLSAR